RRGWVRARFTILNAALSGPRAGSPKPEFTRLKTRKCPTWGGNSAAPRISASFPEGTGCLQTEISPHHRVNQPHSPSLSTRPVIGVNFGARTALPGAACSSCTPPSSIVCRPSRRLGAHRDGGLEENRDRRLRAELGRCC